MKTGTLLVASAIGAGLIYTVTKLKAKSGEASDNGDAGEQGLEFAASFQVQPNRVEGPRSITKSGITYKQVDGISVSTAIKNTGNVLSPRLYVQVQVLSGATVKYTSKTGLFTITPGANPTFTFPLQGEQAYFISGTTDAPGDIKATASLINADTDTVLKTIDSGVLATIVGEFSYTYGATFNISLS